MKTKSYLILENGKVFEGFSMGAQKDTLGEIVFTTGMTGYLETLTDKSYYGQIVVQTFPLIGNYGVIPEDFESESVTVRGYIVKDPCDYPSNFRSMGDLDTLLRENDVPGISGIDTRELTKILREQGTMNGMITSNLDNVDLDMIKAYSIKKPVYDVSVGRPVTVNESGKVRIILLDFGYKENIVRELVQRGCQVVILPCDTSPVKIASLDPDGILLSNGPGDPADNTEIIENIRCISKLGVPIFGICMGHQLLALAHNFKTSKLKYGHRGANQPVKNLLDGKCYITSQNHGYHVTNESIDEKIACPWFVNVNDGTCEGIRYMDLRAFSVQFHPEGSGGPKDTGFLFDEFIREVMVNANR